MVTTGEPLENAPGEAARCLVCASDRWELFATTFDRLRGLREPRWEIRRCRDCGFGWTSPPLAPEQIKDHYPPAYLGNTERTLGEFLSGKLQRTRSWRRETEKVSLVEQFIDRGSILDVGCGDAKFLWALDPNRWSRAGVEFAAATLRLVQDQLPELDLVEGDIFSRQLPEESFDALTFWHVFEHLPQPRCVLRRAGELLRPGGWIFVSLPNLQSLQARLFRRHWYPFDDVPRHLYHFSPRPLEILFQQTGFQLRRHLPFSPMVNIHSLKYSLINWSEERFHNRIPYYLLKPLLPPFSLAERFSSGYGMLTTVGQKARGMKQMTVEP